MGTPRSGSLAWRVVCGSSCWTSDITDKLLLVGRTPVVRSGAAAPAICNQMKHHRELSNNYIQGSIFDPCHVGQNGAEEDQAVQSESPTQSAGGDPADVSALVRGARLNCNGQRLAPPAAPNPIGATGHSSAFSVPSAFVRKMKDLTEASLKVYLVLCSLADSAGKVAGHGVADICRAAGLRERAVQSAFSVLERCRLIKRSRTDGKRSAYRITQPQNISV